MPASEVEHPVPPVTAAPPVTLRKFGGFGLLAILWAALPAVFGFLLLYNLGPISEWLRVHGSTGLAVYIALFVVAAGLGILPTYAQSILGGWVFGFAVGLPAALAGFTGAAIVGYTIARVATGPHVVQYIDAHPKGRIIRNALIGRGPWPTLGTVTLLRFPPNSPFALTNLAMAAARVPLLPFVVGTAVGMLPRTAVASLFAAKGASTGATGLVEFIKEGPGPVVLVAGIVSMIAVLAIVSQIANRALAHFVPEAASRAPVIAAQPPQP